MTAEEALQFLDEHSPLPDDDDLSDELIGQYDEVRKFFLENPDRRSIGPFLRSFGDGSGFGVYQMIEDVIKQFSAEDVLPHLRDALRSPHNGVRYWSLQMVSDFADDSLVPLVIENLTFDDENVRTAAADALSYIGNDDAINALETAIESEEDEDVREAMEEALEDLRGEAE